MSGFNGDIPVRLKEAINSGKCILFVGAGLSANVTRSNGKRLPLWKGLLEELLEYAVKNGILNNSDNIELKQFIEQNKLLLVAQELQKEVDKELGTFFRSVFKDKALTPYEGHNYLSHINCKAILTTNYDTLIEDAFKESKPTVFTQNDLEENSYALREDEFLVIHLHGHIDRPKTIVLGERDYQAFHRKPEYKKYVETLFLSNTVLFIGFGCNDPDIDGIINDLCGVFSGHNLEHYALLPQGMTQREKNRLLQDKRLVVIEYLLDENQGHSQVTEFLKELSNIRSQDNPIQRIKAETSLRETLLSTSREYHDKLRGANGRFYHLKISDTILSGTKEEFIETSVKINNEGDMPLRNSLETLWDKEFKHTVIIGEGGMGKTVSLVRLWEKYLEEKHDDKPVPVFLPLNEYNNTNDEDKKNFIIKMIARAYLDEQNISKESENALWGILKKPTNGKPSVILLLDGFNEITVDKTDLLVELRNIIENSEGVQLIVTSRYDMRQNLNWNNFNRVDLLELSDAQVKAYLKGKSVPDGKLLELVKNPMMLTIYSATSEIMDRHKGNSEFEFKKQVQSAGELLWDFIESQVVKVYDTYVQPSTRAYYKFLLKHILPFVGYEMERMGKFYLELEELKQIINTACKKFSEDNFFEAFPYFEDYEDSLDLGILESSKVRKRLSKVKEILCKELIMLVDESGSFRFLHQHFRDFFAAVHVLNEIAIGLKSVKIPDVLKEKKLSLYVRQFVGEIEGEYYNKPLWASNGWSVEHYSQTNLTILLDMCKGIFEDSLGFTIWNIIEIWKDVRHELTGADLSSLRLTGVGLNGVRCSRWCRDGYNGTKFDYSIIDEKHIFSQGHSNVVNNVVYSSDGRKILSCSDDSTIKEWSVEIGECIKTYEGHSGGVNWAEYSQDGKRILSCSSDGTIKEWSIEIGECIKKYEGHSLSVRRTQYSQDGRRILSCSDDATIKEWSIETGECIKTYEGHSERVNRAEYSRDGKRILSCSDDKTIKEWSIETGECIKTFEGHNGSVNRAEYSEDGKTILSCSDDTTIKEWSVETGECIKTYKGHSKSVRRAKYSQDRRRILSYSNDTTIKEWSVETGECIKTYEGHRRRVRRVEYSQDGKRILSCSYDNTIKEWSIETGKCIKTYEGHNGTVNRAEYSQDGKRILSCSDDNTIKEWSVKTKECIKTYEGYSRRVRRAEYSQDGRRILSYSDDKTIKEWSVETGECIKTFEGHYYGITRAEYSQDGRRMLSCSYDKTIKEWSIETGECIKTYKDHYYGVNRAEYSQDGRRILSCSSDKTIKEWSIETGECIRTYEGHNGSVRRAKYSQDGRRILSCSYDNTIKEWSVETGKCIKTYEGHNGSVRRAEYSQDGRRILSCSDDNTIKEWSVETGECVKTYEGHNGSVRRAEYSQDGRRILSCSHDNTIKEWNVETGGCIKTYEGHLGWVNRSEYSKDGRRILSCSDDNTIKEWSVETGECIKTYEEHNGSVTRAEYSQDGKRILSCSNDGTIKQWDIQTGKCLITIENIPGLFIHGCSFCNLHKDSNLTEDHRRLLCMHGAIVDE